MYDYILHLHINIPSKWFLINFKKAFFLPWSTFSIREATSSSRTKCIKWYWKFFMLYSPWFSTPSSQTIILCTEVTVSQPHHNAAAWVLRWWIINCHTVSCCHHVSSTDQASWQLKKILTSKKCCLHLHNELHSDKSTLPSRGTPPALCHLRW